MRVRATVLPDLPVWPAPASRIVLSERQDRRCCAGTVGLLGCPCSNASAGLEQWSGTLADGVAVFGTLLRRAERSAYGEPPVYHRAILAR